jgi:hypothetical protein
MTYAAQALVYAGLGRTEEALQILDRGRRERDDAVLFVALDPRLRPLRSHPRFQTIVGTLSKFARDQAFTAIPVMSRVSLCLSCVN